MKFFSNDAAAKIPAIIFSGSFALLVATMSHKVNVYDEGVVLVDAARVAQGAALHRDFYEIYGPAQFYILAGLFKVFGTSILVERGWDTIVRATIVTAAFLIVQRGGVRREGFFAAALVSIWMCFLQYYGYTVFPSLLFALLSALCLLPIFEDHRSTPLLFGCGLCIGVTVLFRYDVGFYTFAALTLVAAGYVLSRPLPLGVRAADLLRVLLPTYAGLGLVCIPVAAAYVSHNMLHDFLFDVVYFPAEYYRRMRTMPFPSLDTVLEAPAQIGIYLPFFVWLSALSIVLLFRRSAKSPEAIGARHWIMLLLGSLSAIFYLKGLVRPSLIQLALSIVPALMLSAMLLQAKRRSLDRLLAIAGCAGLVIVFLPTFVAAVVDGDAMVQNAIWMAQRSTWSAAGADTPAGLASCRPVSGLQRSACFEIDQSRADAVRYVEAHTRPNDAIFVGLSRHDRILGNDILFYFFGGWTPATKWYHFDPALQTSREIQTEMIGNLQAAKPHYVVLESEWEDFDEPNESAVSSGVTLLDDFLRSNFQPVQVFGKLTVLRAIEDKEAAQSASLSTISHGP
jgi:hypothetical protein